ncbi:MAG TPA: DUF3617 family protein [Rhizobiaceae bacterium]|nr:DUF3617 family protein [Rhizobiaceae bacterium]
MRRRGRFGFGAFLVAIALMPAAASSFELPAELPARNEGLWIINRTGKVGDGKITFDVQKIWTVCLDPRTDRALHELEIREQQASIASRNRSCEEPQLSVSTNMLSWTMRCSGSSAIADKIGKTDVRHFVTFVNGDETRAETVIAGPDNLAQSRGRFETRMTRLGDCMGGLKPGEMVLMHWRANGEETLKARQMRNVFREIENHKAAVAVRLGR